MTFSNDDQVLLVVKETLVVNVGICVASPGSVTKDANSERHYRHSSETRASQTEQQEQEQYEQTCLETCGDGIGEDDEGIVEECDN
ncbi:hypothetical protein Gotur_015909 [Gossypium turneri]